MPPTVLLLTCLAVSGCDGSLSAPHAGHTPPGDDGAAAVEGSSEVILRRVPGPLAAGTTLHLMLDNRTEETLGDSPCFYELDRREREGWTLVGQPARCSLEVRPIPPRSSASRSLALPSDLRPGEYRVRTVVTSRETGSTRMIETEAFPLGEPTRLHSR